MVKDARGRTAADVAMGNNAAGSRLSYDPHPETAALLRKLMADANTSVADNVSGTK